MPPFHFSHIQSSAHLLATINLFHNLSLQPGHETLYLPTNGTVFVNLTSYAEITSLHGPTFFGNAVGQYEATQNGGSTTSSCLLLY